MRDLVLESGRPLRAAKNDHSRRTQSSGSEPMRPGTAATGQKADEAYTCLPSNSDHKGNHGGIAVAGHTTHVARLHVKVRSTSSRANIDAAAHVECPGIGGKLT